MTTVLSMPSPTTFPSVRQPEMTARPQAQGLAQLLCGGGLIAYGLLRGSWPGLTLAAVGGLLVYRGLTSPPRPADRRRLPPQDDLGEGAWAPSFLPADSEPQLEQEDAADSASPPSIGMERRELAPEEHAEAQMAAYYRALRRGGGSLPAYEHAMAVEDFCLAAEALLRQGAGG